MHRKNATADTTRAELLEAGAALLAEEGFDTTVHVRIAAVTKRAGRTTGSAYQIWPRQHLFHRDLALYVAGQMGQPAGEDPPARVATQVSDWRFHAFVHSWAAASSDAELRSALLVARRDAWRGIDDAWLKQRGRRPVPPRTVLDVATAIGAVVDGFTLRAGLDLDAELDVELVRACVDAVVERMTLAIEPVSPS